MVPPVVLGLLLPLLLLAPGGASAVTPAAHYVPHIDDAFTFQETISVGGGYGNYSGYSETDDVNGTLTVTAVAPNGTVTASYNYVQHYWNSTGTNVSWTTSGSFTFSSVTFRYVHGTDNQTGDNGTPTWFYMNNSLGTGATVSPLGTSLTIESTDYDYALETSAGSFVSTLAANGTGSYDRNDVYGSFVANWQYSSFFDPSTGYIVGYVYVEHDSNAQGDGFVYTDNLRVTHTTYALTTGASHGTYSVTVTESGLGATTRWMLTVDGLPVSGTGSSLVLTGLPNGTYAAYATARGYLSSPPSWSVTISGSDRGYSVSWSVFPPPAPPLNPLVVFVVPGVVILVVVVVLVLVLSRRSRRALPRHSAGGMPRYGGPVAGPPPPISLTPTDQPRIQQIVVKEVVKVKCAYCGSLIDSTAAACPFCGATRT